MRTTFDSRLKIAGIFSVAFTILLALPGCRGKGAAPASPRRGSQSYPLPLPPLSITPSTPFPSPRSSSRTPSGRPASRPTGPSPSPTPCA